MCSPTAHRVREQPSDDASQTQYEEDDMERYEERGRISSYLNLSESFHKETVLEQIVHFDVDIK